MAMLFCDVKEVTVEECTVVLEHPRETPKDAR